MKPDRVQLAAFLALLGLFASECAMAMDWPQWRGPNRNGISSETIPPFSPEGPKLIWTAAVGAGFSSCAITEGRLYTMGNTNEQDIIWCLDAATGRDIWRHSYPARLDPQYYEGGPGATPTVADAKVFTINKWGKVLCLDTAKGSVVWEHNLWDQGIRSNRWGFAGSPLIWHELVILNAGGAGTALDSATGRVVWFNGTDPAGYASPVLTKVEGQEIVLIFAAKALVAIDPRSGKVLWRHPFETQWDTNNPDPIVHGDTVLISSFSHGCELLRMHSNRVDLIYSKKVLYNHLSPGILFGDFLYAFNGEAHRDTDFRCVHVPTGELKWSVKSPAFGSLIGLSGDKVLILSEKGELVLAGVSPSGFGAISRAQVMGGLCWTPPALDNGRIYLRNAKGELKCFEARIAPEKSN